MFCTKCGKQIPDGSKFCTGCGNQIVQSGPKQENPQQPKMLPPQMQQPGQPPAGMQKTQEAKKTENESKRVTIVLLIVLLVLVLVAVGMAVYYFTVLRNDHSGKPSGLGKVTEDRDEDDEDEDDEDGDDNEGESDTDTDAPDGDVDADDTEEEMTGIGPAAEPAEEPRVTSDTNEVIKDTIIYSIPKSAYSYDFDENLGNARVVTRDEGDTMPELKVDMEPQYVVGIDGKAVYLDGTYGIRLDDVQRVGTSFTIAFWMKADDFYDWAPFIHIGYNLLDSSQRCRLWIGQKTDGVSVAPIISSEQARTSSSYEIRPTGTITSMQPGIWYHIAFTVDGARQGNGSNSVRGTLYIAGQRAGEGSIALDTMNTDNLDVYLGINCWDRLYPVTFDSVKIWDQVLDAGQIADLYNAYQ